MKVPEPDAARAAGGLLPALAAQWPSFAAYLVSFATIGIMWINHHAMFQYIRRADRGLMLLHIPFLLCVSALPFPTHMLALYLHEPGARTAMLVYDAFFVVIAVLYRAIWYHGVRDGSLLADDIHLEGLRTISARYRVGPLLYVATLLVAFVSVGASLVCNGLLALLFALPERRRRTPA